VKHTGITDSGCWPDLVHSTVYYTVQYVYNILPHTSVQFMVLLHYLTAHWAVTDHLKLTNHELRTQLLAHRNSGRCRVLVPTCPPLLPRPHHFHLTSKWRPGCSQNTAQYPWLPVDPRQNILPRPKIKLIYSFVSAPCGILNVNYSG